MKTMRWMEAVRRCDAAGRAHVIATVIHTQGSAPRDGGSKMVIDAEETYDSVGGGQLEFLIVQRARELIGENLACQRLEAFPLAAEAAQCCGGNVTVMLECIPACDWQIVLMGSGHVGQALLRILGDLPCRITLVDSRPEMAPATLPENAEFVLSSNPGGQVDELPDDAWVLIFTHEHRLDFDLCCRLLRQWRWQFVGLIGSQTKAERFRVRLRNEGFSGDEIARIACPVGLAQVKGKHPMEVAVSIAAQLQALHYQDGNKRSGQSTSWREMRTILSQSSDQRVTR